MEGSKDNGTWLLLVVSCEKHKRQWTQTEIQDTPLKYMKKFILYK